MKVPYESMIQSEDNDPFGDEPTSGDYEDETAHHYYAATVSAYYGMVEMIC